MCIIYNGHRKSAYTVAQPAHCSALPPISIEGQTPRRLMPPETLVEEACRARAWADRSKDRISSRAARVYIIYIMHLYVLYYKCIRNTRQGIKVIGIYIYIGT